VLPIDLDRPVAARPPRRALWRRAGAVATASLLATGSLLATTAGPSNAAGTLTEVPCPTSNNFPFGPIPGGTAFYHVEVVSTTRTFDAAFGQMLDNNTGSELTMTITVNTQRTVRIQVTHTHTESSQSESKLFSDDFAGLVGVNNPTLTNTVQDETSLQITDEVTTSLGVSTEVPVPPRTKILGLYGVEALDALLNVEIIITLNGNLSKCYKNSALPDFRATAHAPTIVQGFRFEQTSYPVITSVVNPSAGMTTDDIQPGSVVVIQGDHFRPDVGDQVRVTQAGITRVVQAGSFGWKDFESQITFQLPIGLVIGPAQIRVVSDGFVSPPVTIPIVAARPNIQPGSVTNPDEGYTPDNIVAGTVVAIFGQRFTAGGDKVIFAQNGQVYTVGAGSPHWYDSPTQINVMVPEVLQPGQAQVTVVNVHGNLSDPVTFTINDPRPRISSVVEPVGWRADRLMPGVAATIFGDRFRPGEDKVVIVQGTAPPILIEAGSALWHDSRRQINLTLPSSLQAGQAQIYVRHNKGLSDPFTVTIVKTAPTIVPNGVLNPAAQDPFGRWTANGMKSGVLVAILGDFFTPSPGDRVAVRQNGVTRQAPPGSPGWFDSASQINVVLPAGLVPGPAEVLVTNATGLQSAPAPITIVA
jgi:hypothetical protein